MKGMLLLCGVCNKKIKLGADGRLADHNRTLSQRQQKPVLCYGSRTTGGVEAPEKLL